MRFTLWCCLAGLLLTSVSPAQEDAGGAPAAPAERLVQAFFQDTKIDAVLMAISNQSGVPITPYGKVRGARVSVVARNKDIEEVLNQIAQANDWVWFKAPDGAGYGLADQDWYKANILPTQVITKIFRPDHVKASELEKAIRPMLTQQISSVTADDRTNKLIVSDLPAVLDRVASLIRQIDVQLMTRVFYIRHADVNDIASKIETYKSGPGTLEIDEKTHQIIVTDLLTNIKKMELLIDILDVGPEIVIYDVNNIGIDGTDLEDLQNIIDSIRTPDLLFEVNEKQGVFILEDVPEIHDRVEQILASFDVPVKQVLIQGEIISTSFSRNFTFGLKRFIWSDQIFGASRAGLDENINNSGQTVSGFRTLSDFQVPFFELAGSTISGGYLGQEALIEYEATFEDVNTKVLLQPRLLVKNQEASRIRVGSEEPFLSTIFNDNNVSGTRSVTQRTVSDGLTFEVTPSISNSLLVEMELAISNDDAEVVSRNTTEGDNVDLIRRDRQNLDTVLTIPSGETRVIGGLIQESKSVTEGGVPFLVKIPILGPLLFGNIEDDRSRAQLQLFITPTVVEDKEYDKEEKRGELVTGYERVPGSFDLDMESIFQDFGEEEFEPGAQDILSAPDTEDIEAELEQMIRETQPRPEAEVDEGTNYRPMAIGGGDGRPAQPPRQTPAEVQQTVQERTAPAERPSDTQPDEPASPAAPAAPERTETTY